MGGRAAVGVGERFNLTEAEVLYVERRVKDGVDQLDAVRAVRAMRDGGAAKATFRPLDDDAADALGVPRFTGFDEEPAQAVDDYDVLDDDDLEPGAVDVSDEEPTDDEIEEGLRAWADEAVDAGEYPTVDDALTALVELDLATREEQG